MIKCSGNVCDSNKSIVDHIDRGQVLAVSAQINLSTCFSQWDEWSKLFFRWTLLIIRLLGTKPKVNILAKKLELDTFVKMINRGKMFRHYQKLYFVSYIGHY